MGLLLEVFIVGALIYIGWATPLRDYLPASIRGVAKAKTDSTAATQPQPQPPPVARWTSTPSGSWMWDRNRDTALDRPMPNAEKPH